MKRESPAVFKALDFGWYCVKLCVLVGVMVMIVFHTFINSGKTVIENNWTKYRCSPMVMPLANKFGRDTGKNAMNCLFVSFKTSFGFLMKPLQYIMKIIHGITLKHHNSMNLFRAILKPIRIFFMSATKKFYDVINHFTEMSVYLFSRIRDILRRMGATFQLTLYNLQAIQMIIQSIWDGPVGEISRDWIYALDTIKSFFCLAPDTEIRLLDGSIKSVDRLHIGDRIYDGSQATTITGMVVTDITKVKLYHYRGETMSGNHLVWDHNRWKRVHQCEEATTATNKKQFTQLYCPITHSHQLQLNSGVIIRDFEEYSNQSFENITVSNSLRYLNQTRHTKPVMASMDQPGFTGKSLVTMKDRTQQPISEIQIGDQLLRGYVLGKACFRPYYSLVDLGNGFRCTRRQIILDTTSPSPEWKLAGQSTHSDYTTDTSQVPLCYSLITTTGIYQVNQTWASDLLDGLPSSEINAMERKIQSYLNG
jgi:hypothetical protein